ncbi:MAG: exonuclease domain-containing protein [Neisseria sp.]|nr:exonuclease domain-containing protein [Neisseria sp.]
MRTNSSASRYPDLQTAFSRLNRAVVVLDLETTGGNLGQDRITEIAFLRFDEDGAHAFESLVQPEQSISPFITQLTGIDDKMLANAPRFAELAPQLLPLLQGAILVAHNSKFDYNFLRYEFARAGIHFAAPALCSVQLSRKLFPQFHKHSLESIIERHQIAVQSRHRAMADVCALADFLQLACQQHGADAFEAQARALMSPPMPPAFIAESLQQQLYALPDSAGVLLWQDKRGDALFLSNHDKTFREAVQLLHQKSAWQQHIASIQFFASAGALHGIKIQAKLAQQHGLHAEKMPSADGKSYCAVRFVANENGELNAKIITLPNGVLSQENFGLFVNKKAAKQALLKWAKQYALCPKMLDILPYTLPKDAPCPAAQVGTCGGNCQSADGRQRQNEAIKRFAHALPIYGWHKISAMEIVESDAITGLQHRSICENGLLRIDDETYYFDAELPKILKEKFKQKGNNVHILRNTF